VFKLQMLVAVYLSIVLPKRFRRHANRLVGWRGIEIIESRYRCLPIEEIEEIDAGGVDMGVSSW